MIFYNKIYFFFTCTEFIIYFKLALYVIIISKFQFEFALVEKDRCLMKIISIQITFPTLLIHIQEQHHAKNWSEKDKVYVERMSTARST